MLYYLWEIFNINLFSYITFRAGVGFFIALFSALFLMPPFIQWANYKKAKQPISSYTPKNHQNKVGTPTMGGIVIVVSTLIANLIAAKLDNIYLLLGLACLILFSAVGIRDDMTKILAKNNVGLNARTKFGLLLLIALSISIALYIYGLNTNFYIPFYKNPLLDMVFFAPLFWSLVFVSATNAVNITDGLDGLATVPSLFALFSLMVFVYVSGNVVYSSYLFYPLIQGSGEVVIIAASLMGALIGFLWFNCHPAEVFMGDSGSLAIGGVVAYCAIICKAELLLFLISFIFVIEAASVILQIFSIKTFSKKIFLMAPIHHHFEVKGWAESKIIVRFWIIALISNLIALLSLKVR